MCTSFSKSTGLDENKPLEIGRIGLIGQAAVGKRRTLGRRAPGNDLTGKNPAVAMATSPADPIGIKQAVAVSLAFPARSNKLSRRRSVWPFLCGPVVEM